VLCLRLKQIDILGFKSFADKVVFSLSEGITAIVGPNGSGKSNVADAVRWVLGEQSARALRGTKMEDVIFNGTTSRKPISLCEVTLLFENEDGALPMPEGDIAVTRKLYRNGESEYLINNQIVRMRDIQALFYDTGVGREGYSIIGQGRIEEILSAKGEERREALEEAAGVMKYKIRREEARRKLTSVATDIVRLEDILSELEQSLEPLREQREKAVSALALENRLKELEINLFLSQYERNRTRVQSLTAEIETIDQEEANHRKILQQDQQELESLENKFSLVEDLLSRAREKRMELTSTLQRSESLFELTQQKLGFLKQEQARLTEQCDAMQKQEEALQHRLSQGEPIVEEQLVLLEREEQEASKRLDALNEQITAIEDRLDEHKRLLLQHVDGDAQRKARLARMETLQSQAKEREAEVETRLTSAQSEFNSIGLEIELAKQLVEDCKSLEDECKRTLLELEQKQKNAAAEYNSARQTLTTLQNDCLRKENILRTQKQLLSDFEGYNNSVRYLMRDLHARKMDASGVLGTVAGLMKVPKHLETAVEQVLGGSLQNLVVDTQQTAKRLIEYLRTRQYGRVTFLPQQTLRLNLFSNAEKAQINGTGVLGIASELVEYGNDVHKGIQYLLGRTVIVEDIDAGISLTNRCGFSFRCVTLKGDILQSGGAMTGGSVREFNLVSRERLVVEAQEAFDLAILAQKEAENRCAGFQQSVDAIDKSQQDLRQQLYQKQAETKLALERLDATEHALLRAKSQVEQLQMEAERIHTMRTDAQREMAVIEQAQPQNEQILRQAIEEDTKKLAEWRSERDTVSNELSRRRSDLAVKRTERRNQEVEIARIHQEIRTNRQSLASAESELEGNENAQVAAEAELLRIQAESQKFAAAQEENDRAFAAVQSQHEAQSQKRIELTSSIEGNRSSLMELRERKFRIETQLQRLESDFEHMQERLWESYELTYAQAQSLKTEISLQGAGKEAEELRERLKAMGMINHGAIEEYKRVEERFLYLKTQKEDLGRAQEDLEKLIRELTMQMQKQFLERFEIINEHFSRIFKMLFGGGKAELIQAMECNIDIIAQPPGKNLQLITLLSGGERALTAISLLFALLEVHATPFCILDEIEAALDEENLRLFADFLKTYSKNTQFVVITHRRPTMEAASYMYGIAMEEAGVSKTVSVRFA